MRIALSYLCLSVVSALIGCATGEKPPSSVPENADAPAPAEWSGWSDGLRMRVAPLQSTFTDTEAPGFYVEFRANRLVDVFIPGLVPSHPTRASCGLTRLDVWVAQSGTGRRYLAQGLAGNMAAAVPAGRRLRAGERIASTLYLTGPFIPEDVVEKLRTLPLDPDWARTSLPSLPPGDYAMSFSAGREPPHADPNGASSTATTAPRHFPGAEREWTGVLDSGEVRFRIVPARP